MKWFRLYHGTASDPKFGGVSRRTKQSRERILFVWLMLLESASENEIRGEFKTDAESIADTLNCKTEHVDAIIQEFQSLGMDCDGRICKWDESQPANRSIPGWASLRRAVFERDGFICQYCGTSGDGVVLHCDHVIPVSRGGDDFMSNLATACSQCNLEKHAKTPEEWLGATH